MRNKITLYKNEEHTTTNWAGGKTTQLYIYPPQAQFVKRDFDFRISTATVEVGESDFTPLPGYERILLILDGELELTHNEQKPLTLPVYTPHHFLGSWNTHAKGNVRDFNVIYKPGLQVEVNVLHLKEGENITLTPNSQFTAYYLEKGMAQINQMQLEPGDFIQIHQTVEIQAKTPLTLIEVKIS